MHPGLCWRQLGGSKGRRVAGANPTDILWLLVATILVILMQGGFLCLESGFVRAKNGTNVAIKNMIDFCVSSLLFWAFGFGIMFGTSWNGLSGTNWFLFDGGSGLNVPPASLMAFFFFQLAFCSTSTTIVSGAVAERMHFSGYFVTSAVLSGLIYPLFGHWAWGGAALSEPSGWLVTRGFIDFAGSTVVHSVGGWVSLAAILVLGPRLGRYGPQGRPVQGHNIPMAALGTLLLWVGWFGFNGGSQLAMGSAADIRDIATIYINTNLAAAGGAVTVMVLTQLIYKKVDLTMVLNGALGGLVSITAAPLTPEPSLAIIIGAVGGVLVVFAVPFFDKLKIDDVVGALPVHLVCGIWGTLAVPLSNSDASFVNQIVGIAAIGAFTFTASLVVWLILKVTVGIRVSDEEEALGLDKTELGLEAYPEFGAGSTGR